MGVCMHVGEFLPILVTSSPPPSVSKGVEGGSGRRLQTPPRWGVMFPEASCISGIVLVSGVNGEDPAKVC